MMTPDELRGKVRESGSHNRCDLSQVLADPRAFAAAVSELANPFRSESVDVVAGIESMGLLLAGAVAVELGAGIVVLRKPEKVAWNAKRAFYRDYKNEESYLEVVDDAFRRGDRTLIIDDWAETGGQLVAAAALVQMAAAEIAGIAVLNADAKARTLLATRGHRLHSVFRYEV